MTGVFDDVDRKLTAALVRMLELDPALTKDDALGRMERLCDEAGMAAAAARLEALADQVVRHAVLSPLWL
jgi:hypothetical protein